MPRRQQIVPGKIYHVYNRGVDKRKIFLDDKDYLRGIHNLFEFNDTKPAANVGYFFNQNKSKGFGNRYIKRDFLVEILAFCLMPNHFHFLIRPLKDGGLELFMRKFAAGYANYFNQKYERSGVLFQGRYKVVAVEKESHFIHLPFYIHLNPLDLIAKEWRKRELRDYVNAMKFLESYRWSSHLDYVGIKNFPSITQREFLLDFFDGTKGYKKQLDQWIKSMSLDDLQDIALESIY
jgi:putative transposase